MSEAYIAGFTQLSRHPWLPPVPGSSDKQIKRSWPVKMYSIDGTSTACRNKQKPKEMVVVGCGSWSMRTNLQKPSNSWKHVCWFPLKKRSIYLGPWDLPCFLWRVPWSLISAGAARAWGSQKSASNFPLLKTWVAFQRLHLPQPLGSDPSLDPSSSSYNTEPMREKQTSIFPSRELNKCGYQAPLIHG